MKKKMHVNYLIILVLLTAFIFSGCERIKAAYGQRSSIDGLVVEKIVPVFAVATMEINRGNLNDYLLISGDITATSTVDAYSDAAGKVSRLYVSVGSYVNKGDPIAEVDSSRPGMDFVASVVKAPVSGTIVVLPAQVGMTVSQAVPLARISGTGGLEIRLYVAERFISKIEMGRYCEIELDAWPGETFTGKISEISPVVDPSSRTMEIRVAVDNAGSKLKSGMFAKVKIITDPKRNIIKIPANAMLQRFGEDYVFITETDPVNSLFTIARKKLVVPGIHIDGILEIKEGLSVGDEVVVRGQSLLDDGARINIVEHASPLPNN